jgi:hypothetical protein
MLFHFIQVCHETRMMPLPPKPMFFLKFFYNVQSWILPSLEDCYGRLPHEGGKYHGRRQSRGWYLFQFVIINLNMLSIQIYSTVWYLSEFKTKWLQLSLFVSICDAFCDLKKILTSENLYHVLNYWRMFDIISNLYTFLLMRDFVSINGLTLILKIFGQYDVICCYW